MRPPRDSNRAELDAFATVCERLGGFDDRVSPEWIDGYITALAAGPHLPAVDAWLPLAAGDAYERAFADPDDRAQAERALRARQSVIADQLDAEALDADPDMLRLWPLMSEWDDAARAEIIADTGLAADDAALLVTGAVWAEGFAAGLDDHRGSHVAEDDADFAGLVGAVAALSLAEGSDALRAHLFKDYGRDDVPRQTLIDDACSAVQAMRLWWVDRAPVPETRRVGPQPGRNDPCPCGSGRKFKKCHGG